MIFLHSTLGIVLKLMKKIRDVSFNVNVSGRIKSSILNRWGLGIELDKCVGELK